MKKEKTAPKAAAKGAADPKAKTRAPSAEIKDADLDKVTGGLNPQPLPPGLRAPHN